MPPTLILQGLNSLAIAGVGVAALAAVRHAGGFPERFRLAWRAAGLAFLVLGVSGALQNVHGAAAIVGGEGSRVWDGYMRVAPAWNHSREAALIAFALLLLGCAVAPHRLRVNGWCIQTPVLLAATVLGAAAGWLEGSLDFAMHFFRVALLDMAGLLFLISALAAAMIADTVDRLLIVTLVSYSVPLPLNALWFSWMAEHRMAGWAPSPFHMQLYRGVFYLICLALAVRRWRLARRGAYVSGLLATSPGVRPLIG